MKFRLLCCLLVAIVPNGCALRPAAKVLSPVATASSDARAVQLFAATSRNLTGKSEEFGSTSDRSLALNYQDYHMSIPPGHKVGVIEWPTAVPDPERHFAVLARTDLTEDEFAKRVAAASHDGEAVIFIHGYNTLYQEAIFRFAQLVHDTGFNGAPILFSWPSEGKVLAYGRDRESSMFSRDHLERLIRNVAQIPSVKKVHLVAHSMGGWLTAEVLRQAKFKNDLEFNGKLGEVVLASPDIDIDVFRTQIIAIGKRSPPITVLISRNDKALAVSRLIAGNVDRVGAFVIKDPRFIEVLERAGLRVIDMSALQSGDPLQHAKFAASSALLQKFSKDLHSGLAREKSLRGKASLLTVDSSGELLERRRDPYGAVRAR